MADGPPQGPVVALESTIITHGMPYPDNVATARAVTGAAITVESEFAAPPELSAAALEARHA